MSSTPAHPSFRTCYPAPETLGVWFCTNESTQLPAHDHEGGELNLVLAGNLDYEIDGAAHQVCAGQLIVLPRETQHELKGTSCDAAFWVLELSPVRTPDWMQTGGVNTPEDSWRDELVAQLRKLWLRPNEVRAKRLESEVLKLIHAPRSGDPAQVLRVHPAVEKARALFSKPETDDLSIDALAKRAGISASRLANLFQKQLGLTPLQYRNFARLQRFIRVSDSRDPNLMRAALRAGFGSYAQFHRVFCQVCGGPPGAHLRWLSDNDGVSAERTLPSAATTKF